VNSQSHTHITCPHLLCHIQLILSQECNRDSPAGFSTQINDTNWVSNMRSISDFMTFRQCKNSTLTMSLYNGWGQVSLRQKSKQTVLAELTSFGLNKSSA